MDHKHKMAILSGADRTGGVTRRSLLSTAAAAAALGLAAPSIVRANDERVVRIRTSGRSVEDVMRPAVWEPFTKATGIKVVPVASTVAKMLATIRAGQPDVDVANAGTSTLLQADQLGGLLPVNYEKFTFSDLADIPEVFRRPTMIGTYQFATVMAYNTTAYNANTVPKSWLEFWDTAAFPGKRTLQDMAAAQPNLEFALLADGVAVENLYPLDIDRAFAALTRIRGEVAKFWNTSALANQMLIDKEAVLGALWNGPANNAISKGAPLALQWNQHMVTLQSLAVTKGARDPEAAQMLLDFTSTPECQAAMAQGFGYGPINEKAFALLPKSDLGQTVGSPELRNKGFMHDADWWFENTAAVTQRWTQWVLN